MLPSHHDSACATKVSRRVGLIVALIVIPLMLMYDFLFEDDLRGMDDVGSSSTSTTSVVLPPLADDENKTEVLITPAKKMLPAFRTPRPAVIHRHEKGCENVTMGWPFYERIMRERTTRICDGFSQAYCTQYPLEPGSARAQTVFCWFTNVVEFGGDTTRRWVALCKKENNADEFLRSLAGSGAANLGQFVIVETESALREQLPQSLRTSLEAGAKIVDVIPPHPKKFVWAVSGDCLWSNPA